MYKMSTNIPLREEASALSSTKTNKTMEVSAMMFFSIIIAGLIVRIIYAIMDSVKVMISEIYDEEHRDEYFRSSYYWVNTLLVALVCSFLIVIIYEYYVVGHLGKIN